MKKQQFLQAESLFNPKNYFGGGEIVKLNIDIQESIFNNLFANQQKFRSKLHQNSQEKKLNNRNTNKQSNSKPKLDKKLLNNNQLNLTKSKQQNSKKVKQKELKENSSADNLQSSKNALYLEKQKKVKHQRSISGIPCKSNKTISEQNSVNNQISPQQIRKYSKLKQLQNGKTLSQSQQLQTCLSQRENNFFQKNEIIDKINIQQYLSAPKNSQMEIFTKKLTSFLTNGSRCQTLNKSKSINQSNFTSQNNQNQKDKSKISQNIENFNCQYLVENQKHKNQSNLLSPQFTTEKYLATNNFLEKVKNTDNFNTQFINSKLNSSSIKKFLKQYGQTVKSRQASQTKITSNSNIQPKLASPQQQLKQQQTTQNKMILLAKMERNAQEQAGKQQIPLQQISTNKNTNNINAVKDNKMIKNFDKFYPTSSKSNFQKMNINQIFSVLKQQQLQKTNNQE